MVAINRYLRKKYTGYERPEFAPRGSYYSPLPSYEEVQARAAQLFRRQTDLEPGIRLQPDRQTALIKEIADFHRDFDWPSQPAPDKRYYLDNQYFCIGDALVLFGLLRKFSPARIIEVGCGFSSALMLDIDERFLNSPVEFTFIEPEPDRLRSLIRQSEAGQLHILNVPVQEISEAIFMELDRADILFIDSSHVTKIGSDVNYLMFEILPRLLPGVLVHFHDIFWPFEYPLDWIMEGRAWNEAYILRAFLEYNDTFEILLFNSFLGASFPEFMGEQLPGFLENTGGSLWLRKVK